MRSLSFFVVCFVAAGCSPDPFTGDNDAAADGAAETGADAAISDGGEAGSDAGPPTWEVLPPATGPTFRYRALRVVTPNDVWLVGSINGVGAIDHWTQGSHGIATPSGLTPLQAIDLKGPNDIAAVGNGSAAVYNGSAWTGFPHAKGNLIGVWYSLQMNAYYAASATGLDFKLQGTQFLDMSGSPPGGLTCNAMTAMFTVCNNGAILHYDDVQNSFDKQLTGPPTQADFQGIDRRGTTTLAVGTGGATADIGAATFSVGAMEVKASFQAVWVSVAGEVFAVGDNGVIAHRDAGKTVWEQMTSPTNQSLRGVGGIEVNGKLTVFAAGDGGVLLRFQR